jgi:hypothetical protein
MHIVSADRMGAFGACTCSRSAKKRSAKLAATLLTAAVLLSVDTGLSTLASKSCMSQAFHQCPVGSHAAMQDNEQSPAVLHARTSGTV